jgi:ABC-type phosphate transport system substrate-binding protein
MKPRSSERQVRNFNDALSLLLSGEVDYIAEDNPQKAVGYDAKGQMITQKIQTGPEITKIPIAVDVTAIYYHLDADRAPLLMDRRAFAMVFNLSPIGAVRKRRLMFPPSVAQWNAPEIVAVNPRLKSDDYVRGFACSDMPSSMTSEWYGGAQSLLNGSYYYSAPGRLLDVLALNDGAIGRAAVSSVWPKTGPTALVKNDGGEFVAPTCANATLGAEAITPGDCTPSRPVSKGYPLVTLVYVYVKNPCRPSTARFLKWLLSDGQQVLPSVGYAPLPKVARQAALADLSSP